MCFWFAEMSASCCRCHSRTAVAGLIYGGTGLTWIERLAGAGEPLAHSPLRSRSLTKVQPRSSSSDTRKVEPLQDGPP